MLVALRTTGSRCSIGSTASRGIAHNLFGLTLSQYVATYKGTRAINSPENASVFRRYASSGNQDSAPLFEKLDFTLGEDSSTRSQWAIISSNSASRTAFLQTLAGQYVAEPFTARSYPALSEAGIFPAHAIKYVGFDADRGDRIGGNGLRGAYLSARYESRRESTDFSLRDYLAGHTELNGLEKETDVATLAEVIDLLDLGLLADMPVSNLSNGQTRRARIAKALMGKPHVLLLDGPFMGLDPRAVQSVSRVLNTLADRGRPRLVISLKPQEPVPAWIDSLVVISKDNKVLAQGQKEALHEREDLKHILTESRPNPPKHTKPDAAMSTELGEALIEMDGVQVTYGDKTVLGGWQDQHEGQERRGLWWSLHRGQRCGIFGANGSGKTTMLSLITSDHPQTYGLPIKIFGRSRLPQLGVPGISVFDLQKRMGHSSPEVQAFFPKQLTVRRALESAWADAPLAKPVLTAKERSMVDSFLHAFASDLYPQSDEQTSWTTQVRFGELSFSSQRLLLFLRAIISQPDLIILDEAFSGIDEATRDKAFAFLADGHAGIADDTAGTNTYSFGGLTNDQALLVVSHAKDDVPDCVREWIRLPDPGHGMTPQIGRLSDSLQNNPSGWNQIWDT